MFMLKSDSVYTRTWLCLHWDVAVFTLGSGSVYAGHW